MLGRKGFTLLELLIAAVLVGVLTMFATQTFRQTARDVRIETAKRGADTIATAIYRYSIAYPNEDLSGGSLSVAMNKLIDKGFLDNRNYWDASYFTLSLVDGEVEVRDSSGVRVYSSSTKGFVQSGY